MISWDGGCMRNLIFESGVPSYLGSSEHQHSAATGQRNHFQHMGPEHASREKKLTIVNFLIFVQKNVSTIRFQEIKIRQ